MFVYVSRNGLWSARNSSSKVHAAKKRAFLVVLIAISRQAGSLGLTLSMDKAD